VTCLVSTGEREKGERHFRRLTGEGRREKDISDDQQEKGRREKDISGD
jgi:hypothetical protein